MSDQCPFLIPVIADTLWMSPTSAYCHRPDAPVIVDVRTGREFEAGHVPGAIHVPFYTLLVRQDDVPGPRDRPVVVYCEHGPRAGVARLALRLAGFTDVRYLDGHMSGWKRRGLPQELR